MTETTLLLDRIRQLVEAQRGEGVAISARASRELADAVYELDQLLSGDSRAPLPDQWVDVTAGAHNVSSGFQAFLGGMAGSFIGSLVREGPEPVPIKPPRLLTAPAKKKRRKR